MTISYTTGYNICKKKWFKMAFVIIRYCPPPSSIYYLMFMKYDKYLFKLKKL